MNQVVEWGVEWWYCCEMTTRVGWIPCIGAPPPLGTATYLPKKKRFLNEGKGGAKFGAPETLVSWFMQYSIFMLNRIVSNGKIITKNLQEYERQRWWQVIFWSSFQNFTAGPQEEPSVGISVLGVDIRNWDLQNMKHNRQSRQRNAWFLQVTPQSF